MNEKLKAWLNVRHELGKKFDEHRFHKKGGKRAQRRRSAYGHLQRVIGGYLRSIHPGYRAYRRHAEISVSSGGSGLQDRLRGSGGHGSESLGEGLANRAILFYGLDRNYLDVVVVHTASETDSIEAAASSCGFYTNSEPTLLVDSRLTARRFDSLYATSYKAYTEGDTSDVFVLTQCLQPLKTTCVRTTIPLGDGLRQIQFELVGALLPYLQ